MENKEPELINVEVELDEEHLEYLKRNNLDLNELIRKLIDGLILKDNIIDTGKISDGYQPWIKSLNIGDYIAIKHKNYISHNKILYTTDKVKCITSDGLIKMERFPYEFEFGISIHDVWDSQTHMLTPITQDVLDSIEKQDLENWFDMIDKTDLSLEQLREIKAIVGGE